jgi:hypothetical protein
LKGVLPGDQSPVEVTVASSYGADDRVERRLHLRRRLVQPSQFAGLNDGQFLHDFPPQIVVQASDARNSIDLISQYS